MLVRNPGRTCMTVRMLLRQPIAPYFPVGATTRTEEYFVSRAAESRVCIDVSADIQCSPWWTQIPLFGPPSGILGPRTVVSGASAGFGATYWPALVPLQTSVAAVGVHGNDSFIVSHSPPALLIGLPEVGWEPYKAGSTASPGQTAGIMAGLQATGGTVPLQARLVHGVVIHAEFQPRSVMEGTVKLTVVGSDGTSCQFP